MRHGITLGKVFRTASVNYESCNGQGDALTT